MLKLFYFFKLPVLYLYFKDWADRFVALLTLILFSPLLLSVALLVRWRLGSPVIFRQKRPGFCGRPFWLLKFRTMTNIRDVDGSLLPDALRLSPFGCWLRATSLDELPGLINILRGEMSFVGPRPLLMKYLPLYSVDQARRHDVKPGFSGWAQINGRNSLSWDEKFNFDVYYVDNISFLFDMWILLVTIWKVISKEGISPPNQLTMPPFKG